MQMPAHGAVQVEGDGDEWGAKRPPVAAAPAWKRLASGIVYPWQESGLALIGEVRGSSVLPRIEFPRLAGMQTRPSGGFCFLGSGSPASRKWSRARSLFRAPRKPALSRDQVQEQGRVDGRGRGGAGGRSCDCPKRGYVNNDRPRRRARAIALRSCRRRGRRAFSGGNAGRGGVGSASPARF